MSQNVITSTDLTNYTPLHRGKVRDLYDLGDELLIISTDRISAFDVVLPNGIPDKGKVLTGFIQILVQVHRIRCRQSSHFNGCRRVSRSFTT